MNLFTFYESSSKLQEALREVEKIDSITKDPSINDYSDKLIRENESNRSQCLQNSAKTEALAKKIDFLKDFSLFLHFVVFTLFFIIICSLSC